LANLIASGVGTCYDIRERKGKNVILFEGNDRLAYRDPACIFWQGAYYLFFTVSEKENGYMYNRVGMSISRDLINWTEPRLLTPKDVNLNFCSPGNIIKAGEEYVICFTSYPMPFPYARRHYADDTARLFLMRTRDFEHFTDPELLNPKGDALVEELGRMIDPFILPKGDEYFLFYKQNGVSVSKSRDLKKWEYLGHAQAGENACVIQRNGEYLLVHSPQNGIAFSRSKDLTHWEEAGVTTLDQLNWPWAQGRITAGFAMEAPKEAPRRYLLFFHGSRDIFPETHGNATLALAYTDDFESFYYE